MGHIAFNCPKRSERVKVAVVKALEEIKLSSDSAGTAAAAAPEPGFV